MRNPASVPELQSLDRLIVSPLDVTDQNSIKDAVSATLKKFGSIDVLLNNAGYGLVGPMEAVTPAQLERQFATNVYAPTYTMQACSPHFRGRKAGLIMNVTSVGGRLALPFNSLDHGTKFALEGLSESLALELAPQGIQVKLIEPGGARTDFAGRSLDWLKQPSLTAYDQSLLGAVQRFMDPTRAVDYSDASYIAEAIFEATTDGKDQFRYLLSKDAQAMVAHRATLSDEAYRDWSVQTYQL
ncbi:SDR family NAD(P)-dependent oxidoreductase [Rhodoferax sp. PAMC 29310]|uniref:SDR family NAD(P)-dependent oxidoreductase n=1 Tax=Rhodoferax sp. PAMC 29310 TaxID=2822760 RepID=UPI001B322448|nr:SDR family NAD(P)-dependent oxidoreductase [Rhodoferax sp. PAMC 29310]